MSKKMIIFSICISVATIGFIGKYVDFNEYVNADENSCVIEETGCIVDSLDEECCVTEIGVKDETTLINEKEIEVDKEYAAIHMLNAVDYYNTAEGSFVTNMQHGELETLIEFVVSNDFSYDSAKCDEYYNESYCGDGRTNKYFNNDKQMMSAFTGIDDTSYNEIPFSGRMSTKSNGEKVYQYRSSYMQNASMCLLSQELCFGLLGDFDLWEITEESEFLGYPVIIIEGKTEEMYGEKLNISNFRLYLEKTSGIVMKLEGYDSFGNISNYIEMKNISINKELTKSKEKIIKYLDEKAHDYTDLLKQNTNY